MSKYCSPSGELRHGMCPNCPCSVDRLAICKLRNVHRMRRDRWMAELDDGASFTYTGRGRGAQSPSPSRWSGRSSPSGTASPWVDGTGRRERQCSPSTCRFLRRTAFGRWPTWTASARRDLYGVSSGGIYNDNQLQQQQCKFLTRCYITVWLIPATDDCV